jgi:hypothetical protein
MGLTTPIVNIGAGRALHAAAHLPHAMGSPMGPWTLAYLASHRDMNITNRYVHPQEETIRACIGSSMRGKEWGYFRAYYERADPERIRSKDLN